MPEITEPESRIDFDPQTRLFYPHLFHSDGHLTEAGMVRHIAMCQNALAAMRNYDSSVLHLSKVQNTVRANAGARS